MKYAIVGGWGYLGVNLVKELPSCIITRRSSKERRKLLEKYFEGKEIYVINEVNEVELGQTLERCGTDVLVYAVGKLRGSPSEMIDAHVNKAKVALRLAKNLNMRYVYVSSVAAMGIAERCAKPDLTVTEEAEHLKGCEPAGPYSYSKMLGEKEVMKEGADGIVRPALIWGDVYYHPEQKLLRVLKRYGLPWINLSVSTIPCIAIGIERAMKGGWYLTVDGDLRDVGVRAIDWRPPYTLVKKAPGSLKMILASFRYRYESSKLECEVRAR